MIYEFFKDYSWAMALGASLTLAGWDLRKWQFYWAMFIVVALEIWKCS